MNLLRVGDTALSPFKVCLQIAAHSNDPNTLERVRRQAVKLYQIKCAELLSYNSVAKKILGIKSTFKELNETYRSILALCEPAPILSLPTEAFFQIAHGLSRKDIIALRLSCCALSQVFSGRPFMISASSLGYRGPPQGVLAFRVALAAELKELIVSSSPLLDELKVFRRGDNTYDLPKVARTLRNMRLINLTALPQKSRVLTLFFKNLPYVIDKSRCFTVNELMVLLHRYQDCLYQDILYARLGSLLIKSQDRALLEALIVNELRNCHENTKIYWDQIRRLLKIPLIVHANPH